MIGGLLLLLLDLLPDPLTLPRWPLLSQRWLRRRLTVLRHAGLLFLRFSV